MNLGKGGMGERERTKGKVNWGIQWLSFGSENESSFRWLEFKAQQAIEGSHRADTVGLL